MPDFDSKLLCWFAPTRHSAHCAYPRAQVNGSAAVFSICNVWRTKVPVGRIETTFMTQMLHEMCPKCAALAGLKVKPRHTSVHHVRLSMFSRADLVPIEDMPTPTETPASLLEETVVLDEAFEILLTQGEV